MKSVNNSFRDPYPCKASCCGGSFNTFLNYLHEWYQYWGFYLTHGNGD